MRFKQSKIVELLNTTATERDIYVVYVYKGIEAEREAVHVMAGLPGPQSSVAIGYSASSVGDAFVHTFANCGASIAVLRHIQIGQQEK